MFDFALKIVSSLYQKIKRKIFTFITGFIAAVLCFIVLNAAMVPISKSEYCGTKCHEMNTAYLTWELSTHGTNTNGIRVECIDCHLPSKDKYFTHVTAKAYAGAKDILIHYFGSQYNVEKIRKMVLDNLPSQRCANCHDNLLVKPSSSAAWTAHKTALSQPDKPENRCVVCHENVGHQRYEKTYTP